MNAGTPQRLYHLPGVTEVKVIQPEVTEVSRDTEVKVESAIEVSWVVTKVVK